MSYQTIVVSGASGLIGSALIDSLRSDGIRVRSLVRRSPASPHEFEWDPSSGSLDRSVLAGADAVVNLNGASIGKLPWTRKYREVLRSSRLNATQTIVAALQEVDNPPALISASAVGFYGNQPGQILTETSPAGRTFLARLCVEWERSALMASPYTRVALLRTAPVLAAEGVLKPMVTLTKFGLGGPLGSGRQIWPWISLEDEVRAIRHVIDSRIEGPINLCGPIPAAEDEVGRALAQSLGRPFLVPAPAFLVRGAIGRDPADSLLLADANVQPQVLNETGFRFTHETAKSAIFAAMSSTHGPRNQMPSPTP